MSIDDWHVGQKVTVHFPHANQGSRKTFDTTISKKGRKYLSVSGLQAAFDATLDVPRSSGEELYTPEGYIELSYTNKVLQELQRLGRPRRFPISLIAQIGDNLGIERPAHLRKEPQHEANNEHAGSTSTANGKQRTR